MWCNLVCALYTEVHNLVPNYQATVSCWLMALWCSRAEDPQLAEFMRVMQPRRQAAIWANDDALPNQAPGGPATGGAAVGPSAPGPAELGPGHGETLGSGDVLPAPPRRGRRAAQWAAVTAAEAGRRAAEARKGGGEEDEEEEEEDSEDENEDGEPGGRGPAADETVSDMEYLRSRMTARLDADDGAGASADAAVEAAARSGASPAAAEPSADGSDSEDPSDAERRASHAGAGPRGSGDRGVDRAGGAAEVVVADGAAEGGEPAVVETGRLFVRNLPYTATEADLAEAFGEHGELQEVHLVLDR